MLDQQEKFDEVILSYVQKNSKNSTLTKEKNRKIQEAKKHMESKEKPIRLPDNNDSQASKPKKIRF
jgi:tetraacyldisaccharide 4'-kinase